MSFISILRNICSFVTQIQLRSSIFDNWRRRAVVPSNLSSKTPHNIIQAASSWLPSMLWMRDASPSNNEKEVQRLGTKYFMCCNWNIFFLDFVVRICVIQEMKERLYYIFHKCRKTNWNCILFPKCHCKKNLFECTTL